MDEILDAEYKVVEHQTRRHSTPLRSAPQDKEQRISGAHRALRRGTSAA
jgi:hypothetical protein